MKISVKDKLIISCLITAIITSFLTILIIKMMPLVIGLAPEFNKVELTIVANQDTSLTTYYVRPKKTKMCIEKAKEWHHKHLISAEVYIPVYQYHEPFSCEFGSRIKQLEWGRKSIRSWGNYFPKN